MSMELFDTTSRIAVLESEVRNIVSEVKELRREQKDQHEMLMKKMSSLDERLGAVERWKWMLLGASIVIGYVLAHIRIEKLF